MGGAERVEERWGILDGAAARALLTPTLSSQWEERETDIANRRIRGLNKGGIKKHRYAYFTASASSISFLPSGTSFANST